MIETSEKSLSEPIDTESIRNEAGRSLMTLAKVHESPECEPILRGASGSVEISSVEIGSVEIGSVEIGSVEIAVTELRATAAGLLEPLAQSLTGASTGALTKALTEALGELTQRIHESESRQCSTIEAALQRWEGERESKAAERLMEVEAMRMRSQSEINRILRVMWLGTGAAAGCAAAAMYLFRN